MTHTLQSPAQPLDPMHKADASRALADIVTKMAGSPNLLDGELAQRTVEAAEALVAGMAVIQDFRASDSAQ